MSQPVYRILNMAFVLRCRTYSRNFFRLTTYSFDIPTIFQQALNSLQDGNMEDAEKALWPGNEKEEVVTDLPEELKSVLQITT